MISRTLSDKLQTNLVEGYKNKMLSDDEVVQLIELGFDLLGLKSYSDAAKELKKSYNGIKKFHPKKVKINNLKFVITN